MKHLTRIRAFWGSFWNTLLASLVCLYIVLSALLARWEHKPPSIQRVAERAINRQEYALAQTLLAPYVEENPDEDYFLRLYGMVLLNLGRREEGHEFYRRSLIVHPHQPGLFQYLKRVGELPPQYRETGGPDQ